MGAANEEGITSAMDVGTWPAYCMAPHTSGCPIADSVGGAVRSMTQYVAPALRFTPHTRLKTDLPTAGCERRTVFLVMLPTAAPLCMAGSIA